MKKPMQNIQIGYEAGRLGACPPSVWRGWEAEL